MLVATFGPTTGWAGKTITYVDEQFVLDGYGPIPAADVLNYGGEGHLLWAYDGLQEWVRQTSALQGAPALPPPQHPVPQGAPALQPPQRTVPLWRRTPRWVFYVVAVCVVLAIVGAVIVPWKVNQNSDRARVALISGSLPKLNQSFELLNKVCDQNEGKQSTDFSKAVDQINELSWDPTIPDPHNRSVVRLQSSYVDYLLAVADYSFAIQLEYTGTPLAQARAECVKCGDAATSDLQAAQ